MILVRLFNLFLRPRLSTCWSLVLLQKDKLTLTAVQKNSYSQKITLFLMTNEKIIQYQFILCKSKFKNDERRSNCFDLLRLLWNNDWAFLTYTFRMNIVEKIWTVLLQSLILLRYGETGFSVGGGGGFGSFRFSNNFSPFKIRYLIKKI